jgi:chromatin structure-remodeling complex protein RSC7
VHIIDSNEFITEDNPIGNEKIDKFGNLLGGMLFSFFFSYVEPRELGHWFKAAMFILPNRHPQRQYMLAVDAACTSRFCDSLYYFC